jgi:hypothetical protein
MILALLLVNIAFWLYIASPKKGWLNYKANINPWLSGTFGSGLGFFY